MLVVDMAEPVIAFHFKGLDLLRVQSSVCKRLFIRDSAGQSLSTEHTELNLSHAASTSTFSVEPTVMFGRVVELETFEKALGFGGFKRLIWCSRFMCPEIV